jgi:hypothetical protein
MFCQSLDQVEALLRIWASDERIGNSLSRATFWCDVKGHATRSSARLAASMREHNDATEGVIKMLRAEINRVVVVQDDNFHIDLYYNDALTGNPIYMTQISALPVGDRISLEVDWTYREFS